MDRQSRPTINVTDLLQGKLSSLSPRHKTVADFLLTHLDDAAFFTGAEIAQRAGTSEATVVRFARALGYAGFPDFQQALQDLLRQKLAPRQRLAHVDHRLPGVGRNRLADLLDRTTEQSVVNAQETRGGLGGKEMEAAAQALVAADTIYVVGLRASAGPAALLGHYLTQIQPRVQILTEAGPSLFERMALLSKRDAVIAVSYPRYTRWTVECLRVARGKEAATLAITDSPLSPAAQIVEHVFVGASASLSFGHSYVGAMCIIDALITLVVAVDRKRSLQRLDAIEQLIREQDFFYGGSEILGNE